ncbi:MAG: glycosyltransferase family 2 protein [Bacteroidia bacterium]|nr:glycosyltransferase family 2 protein [Bacteroidia bacterium]
MKISGFSFAKNTSKLYFPLKEAIQSILPIVDEFVLALGDCDEDDLTREQVLSIPSDKIRIIDTVWDLEAYPRGMENAHQTDIAKNHCSGDWLFYVQADEVIHEKFLPSIVKSCEDHLENEEVEGLLFDYKHFWGDYGHVHQSHGWYQREIRIVKNNPNIHSWESAQSFRYIEDFDGKSYRQKEGSRKLRVAKANAEVYHYGWVRPPRLMRKKMKALSTIHHGTSGAEARFEGEALDFDYGDMSRIPQFKGTHPAVMEEFISRFDWGDQLRWEGGNPRDRKLFKHEKLKYRMLSWVENNLRGGEQLFAFKNYEWA